MRSRTCYWHRTCLTLGHFRRYRVKACVRDVADPVRTDFLKAMPAYKTGRLTLHNGDVDVPGIFDDILPGCHGFCHVSHVSDVRTHLSACTLAHYYFPNRTYHLMYESGALCLCSMATKSIFKAWRRI